MRLLLDTHIFIWCLDAPERLSPDVLAAVEAVENDVFISAVVGWEIAIKTALGKLTLPESPATYVPDRIARLGFRALPIAMDHALAAGSLPPIHGDPFDRLLIAQASVEALTLVSVDSAVRTYASVVASLRLMS